MGGRSARDPPPMERRAKLARTLEQIDSRMQELADEACDKAPPASAPAAASGTRAADVEVIIGTSELAQDPAMVTRIMTMVNESYYESIKALLHPSQTSYERLSRDDVIDRLEMGDAGLRANRVLHIAFRGASREPSAVVGCMSSTFQPPWTEQGCGHWGLLVVAKECQGQGIASVLVAAAEERLAGSCHEIQIEYEYTPEDAYSERLMRWYEGSCGFRCAAGRSRGGGTQFRKCRKRIPAEVARRAEKTRLEALRAEISAALSELDQATSSAPDGAGPTAEHAPAC